MSKRFCLCVAAISLWLGQAARLSGQTPEREMKTAEAKAPEPCDAATTKEDSSVTDHSIRIGGQTIPYKATASMTLVSIGSTPDFLEGRAQLQRPVTRECRCYLHTDELTSILSRPLCLAA
jgi:hypothetical protein